MPPSSRRESRCGFESRHGYHFQPIKKGTMKRLFDIIVPAGKSEGFAPSEWMIGCAFCTAIVAICLVAEIINAL